VSDWPPCVSTSRYALLKFGNDYFNVNIHDFENNQTSMGK